jgi:serine/threonine-protein kinase
VGDVIAGKYAIAKVLGEGGMGVVYEANHLRLRQRVAIKMLLPQMMTDAVVVERFEREARAASQLRSRHVARVVDVDATADGVPYMVMEFLEGHDLEVELEKRRRIPCDEAVDFVLQACAAMIEAHALGIVHRDLKPSNLFLASDPEQGTIVKVLDFGISKLQSEGDSKLTGAEAVMGTAMYMSPEQVRSSMNADARTDIWALGVILFELITGSAPFLGTPTQVAAAIVADEPADIRSFALVPNELAETVKRTLEKDAAKRFRDVRELAAALLPHATPGGVGRNVIDGILVGASGSNRMALDVTRRQNEVGGTSPNGAVAGSPPSIRSGADGGTAPGWSQHRGGSARRGPSALVWMLLAFVGGTVVLGGGTFAFFELRRPAVVDVPTLAAPSQPAPVAPSAAPAAAATATAEPTAIATSDVKDAGPAAAHRPRGSAAGAAAPAPAHPSSAPPPAKPLKPLAPAPADSGMPTFL